MIDDIQVSPQVCSALGATLASPDPTLPERPAPLRGPTAAASMLVGVTCVAALLDAWTTWYRHGVAVDYVAGAPGVRVADLTSADSTGRTVDVLYVFSMIGACVALLVWLSRLRANARRLDHAAHRVRRRLALGGWFAVTLFAAATTLLFGANASVAELRVLATIDSFVAVIQCVVGVLLILVVRKATSSLTKAETNQPGSAMRE